MKPRRTLASFSLVEMLVSIAIFTILMVLIFGILGDATRLWRQQASKEESFREARAALNTLSRDMSSAVVSTNTYWFYTSPTPLPQMAFLTTLPDVAQGTANKGDICAVGYSLEYGTNSASGSQTNMSLYRYVSFSNNTYTNFISNPASTPIQSIFINPDGVNVVRELIARNVAQISFTSYTNDPSGGAWVSSQAFLSNMMINVGITIVNNKTASQLTTQAQWQNISSPLIQQNQESFTLRVRPRGP